jgi:NAD(P)-dependent dehydrogenase (short-subunit alcohol dehydrogenase family)
MPGRLDNKVAVITGGTSGIGEATARRFVAEGARVVIAGRSTERGNALAAELGEQAFFVRADVMREAEIAAVIDAAVARFGQLDCLFNNAGAAAPGELDTLTEEQFDFGMKLLVGSIMFGIKHAAPAMRARGGSIINNSSIAAHRLGQGGALYSAAKAAVSHITRIAGAKFGPDGIRVNSISPGAIATPIFWGGSAKAETMSAEENARKLAKLEVNLARATPLPRSGIADDIAYAAVFLASDEGGFVNAHDLVVDGGRIAQFYERPIPAKD